MNALIRQIAVLSVLWAVCELILPDGRYQRMVRMIASLLVMAALTATAGEWFEWKATDQPVVTALVQQSAEESYRRSALTSVANQLENWCEQLAGKAGYEARAVVYLTMDGALDHVQMKLKADHAALIPESELKQLLAQQLEVQQSCILLLVEDA